MFGQGLQSHTCDHSLHHSSTNTWQTRVPGWGGCTTACQSSSTPRILKTSGCSMGPATPKLGGWVDGCAGWGPVGGFFEVILQAESRGGISPSYPPMPWLSLSAMIPLLPNLPCRTWSAVCGPYIGEDLVWHPVTPEMGSPKLQGPECCAELKRPTITQFFEKKSGAKRKTDSTPEDTPGGKLARNSDEVGETRGSQQISQMGSQPATPAPAIKKESPKPSDAVGAAEDAKGQGDRQDPIEKEEVVEEPTPTSSPQPKSKPSPAGKGGRGALSSPDPSEKQASITQFFSKKS